MIPDDDGTFPAYAWPGGYPIIYILADGATLCAKCANGENGSDAYVGEPKDGIEDKQWKIEAQDIHWEGPAETCAHCNASIESAYGVPE